ncbi:hypothetical protein [Desulfonatronovibrio hydrogenovorans]|uniref:hypothetical protein n=1 Tax=Desulfonatronovibrio hydrogenovorans TaxID=53245 RepID=UPI0012947092|nr:hypothetical protein [Desulfonatronovibrio hydrogenovorans]
MISQDIKDREKEILTFLISKDLRDLQPDFSGASFLTHQRQRKEFLAADCPDSR